MTFATFVPAIAFLLLVPCLLVSQQVGIAIRSLYLIWATRTLSQAGFPDFEIWHKSDTNHYLSHSAWFIGVAGWFSSLWIMVLLEGLLLRTDVMMVLATTSSPFAPGIDGSVVWQVVAFVVLITSLMTHDHVMGWARNWAHRNKSEKPQTT